MYTVNVIVIHTQRFGKLAFCKDENLINPWVQIRQTVKITVHLCINSAWKLLKYLSKIQNMIYILIHDYMFNFIRVCGIVEAGLYAG